YGNGLLEINTSDVQKTEQLTLKGIGPNGTDLTQTFVLPAQSFILQIAGQARIRVPGTDTDLLKLNGGFYMRIDPTQFTIYETAELSFGIGSAQITYSKSTGVFIIQTGVGAGQNAGVAGYFKIGASAGIGLPDIGTLF